MNTITLDPPTESLDARHLNVLIARWLTSLDVAPSTLRTYSDKIGHFVSWWERTGPCHNWQLTQALLDEFERSLRRKPTARFSRPLSFGTRHAIIRALRMMFKWAYETNRTARNYGLWVPWPAGSPTPRKAATVQQLRRLLKAAGESPQALRDEAIIAFFIGTGCRRGEVAGLNIEDLTILPDLSGTAVVTGKRTAANETGLHSVAFDSTVGEWLTLYLAASGLTEGFLWLNNDGNQLSEAGVYLMVKRTIKRAGLTNAIHGCHDLRRAFATILSQMHPESQGWADLLRRQLGHKHYAMTTKYVLLDADDIRVKLKGPLAD